MILRLTFIIALSLLSNLVLADSTNWLLGKWQMTYDPDGDTKDTLLFSEGGEFVTTEASSGRQIKGMYFVKDNAVDIKLIHQGKIFMTLKLTYTDKKDKLFYNPDKTNNPAYYTKLK